MSHARGLERLPNCALSRGTHRGYEVLTVVWSEPELCHVRYVAWIKMFECQQIRCSQDWLQYLSTGIFDRLEQR